MTDIVQRLADWQPYVLGQYINEDWNIENQGFGAQCWDLAANWSKFLGLPVINTGGNGRWPGWAGNMVDAFPQTPAIAAAYQLISPDQPMLAGDIVVWDDSYWYYPKTHVAVGVADAGALLLCASQNSSASLGGNPYPQWTTGPAILQHLPKQGCIGYIRPRTGTLAPQGTTITKEVDELSAADVQEIKEYVHALLVKGYQSAGQNKPGIADIVTENQRRIGRIPEQVWEAEFVHGGTHSARTELVRTRQEVAALRGAIAALAKNPSITPAQITEAVQAALAEAVIDVDVTVNGKGA